MKNIGQTIFWSTILITIVYFGFQAIRTQAKNKISFSYHASEEFKNRITHVLTFLETNHPTEYQLIKENVKTIKEQKGGGSFNRAHISGASYARVGEEWSDPDHGLIALMSVPQHCPPSLIKNKNQTINCASVIYHEAMHHYHANNNMYQDDPNLEHYHVYKKDYAFIKKMGGEKQTKKLLYERMNDFKSKARSLKN